MSELSYFYQRIFEQHHDAAWDAAPGKDVLIRALDALPPPPAEARSPRLLDIGCGTGFMLDRISREVGRSFELHGVDFAPTAIARGQRRYPALRLSCQDGAHTSFEPESFEVLVSYGSMEHFPKPDAAIAEVSRLLSPGGVFLIMLPTLGAYRNDRGDEGWYEDLTGQPQWNLLRGTWTRYFQEVGLKLWATTSAAIHGARQPEVYFFGEKPARSC